MITVRSTLGKLFEKMINSRLTDHYEQHHPLNQLQNGFRRKILAEEAIHHPSDALL
jgi:hypothetical protein